MKEFPDTDVTEAQVYMLWLRVNETEWKLDPDQAKSARMILEREAGKAVDIIETHDEDGFAALGFALKEPLKLWGEATAEIAIDGTCT